MSEDEPDLLTQNEVAKLLRCEPSKVKRLRLVGELAYIPGRPVMIRRKAVDAYLETIEKKAVGRKLPPAKSSIEAAAERAREKWILMHLRKKPGR